MVAEQSYKPILIEMMSYLDQPAVAYTVDHEFTQEQLAALTPASIMQFFNFRAFGVPNPPQGHDVDPLLRSNTLKYWKKALSHFMPNRMMAWNELSGVGNPTRCNELNQLLRFVKRKEVRGQGAESQARRATTALEFEAIHSILKAEGSNTMEKFGIPAMMNIQYHLIARIDDTSQQLLENVKAHNTFIDFVLKGKLNWSKNVLEERDAPWQTILAANNPLYDTHLSLGVWLESFLEDSPVAELTPYVFTFSDDIVIPTGGRKSKNLVSAFYTNEIFNRIQFQGALGSHSFRKYASTDSRNKGASKDERDLRGRWKSSARIADVYDDIELPYPDAKVAAMLCPGGPIKYKIRDDSNVTEEFITNYVVPNTTARLGNEAGLVIGKAVLWGAFSGNNDRMPPWLRTRIQEAYASYINNDLEPLTNPIKKVPIVVTGNEGEVYIDEIPDDLVPGAGGINGGNGNNTGAFVDRPIREQLLAVHSQLLQIRRGQDELREQVQNHHIQHTRNSQTMLSNIRRLARTPGRRFGNGGGVNDGVGGEGNNGNGGGAAANNNNNNDGPGAAALSPTPRCLFTLWNEYMVGIGGRKAARLFTAAERGQVKHRYTRRKVVWDTIDRLIRRGFTAHVAIDQIYQQYGRELTVTRIINRMLEDRRRATIPAALM
jgi:hypothetical protein